MTSYTALKKKSLHKKSFLNKLCFQIKNEVRFQKNREKMAERVE